MEPRISMLGLTRWESEFVQTTVNIASGIEIAPWRFVEDPYRADVLLVDAERSRHELLDDESRSTDLAVPIVVSFTAASEAIDGRGLTRPVRYAELISMLKEIEGELHDASLAPSKPATKPASKPVSKPSKSPAEPKPPAPPSIDAVPPAPAAGKGPVMAPESLLLEKSRPARRFVEGTRFIGLVRQVLRQGRPINITHARFPDVQLFPGDRRYASGEDVLRLPTLFRESALHFSMREIPETTAAEIVVAKSCRPIGPLLYSAALFGSEGRLLLNCNPDDRLGLVNWPNFNVIPHIAEHKDIARYMLANDATLLQIASATRAEMDTVIGFCNACEAVGLVRRIPAATASAPDTGRAQKQVLQLMERIRDMFRP